MSKISHKKCYGTMLPTGSHHDHQGKSLSLNDTTPMGMMPPHRVVHVDMEQWDDCIQCPEFSHCYKLCMAKITVEGVNNNE